MCAGGYPRVRVWGRQKSRGRAGPEATVLFSQSNRNFLQEREKDGNEMKTRATRLLQCLCCAEFSRDYCMMSAAYLTAIHPNPASRSLHPLSSPGQSCPPRHLSLLHLDPTPRQRADPPFASRHQPSSHPAIILVYSPTTRSPARVLMPF